jgi:Fic family protein
MSADDELPHALERGLGSPGRLRILRLLLSAPEHRFTRYEIGKVVALKPTHIRNNLKTLLDLGWVVELKVRPRRYAINLESAVVQELRAFFRKVRYLGPVLR